MSAIGSCSSPVSYARVDTGWSLPESEYRRRRYCAIGFKHEFCKTTDHGPTEDGRMADYWGALFPIGQSLTSANCLLDYHCSLHRKCACSEVEGVSCVVGQVSIPRK